MNNIGQSAGKNLAWLAGFMEGDGSVKLSKARLHPNRIIYSPSITFSNTDALIIEECVSVLKEYNIGCYIHAKRTVNGIAFDLTVKGFKRVEPLALLLVDYLVGKKKTQIELVIEWIQSRKETGNSKTYTKRELEIPEIITELHSPSYPQRLHAGLPIRDEDIVRTAQRCAELSRNAIAGLKKTVTNGDLLLHSGS
jgi:hypothetical protein